MRSKWYLLSLIFMVLFVSVGAISAADNSTVSNMSEITESVSLDTSSNNGNSIIGGSSNGTSIKSDVHVTTDDGSEIQNEISNSNNTVIYLDNQTFVLNSTSNYGLCVDSNKNLTICGGYSIGDGKTSTLSAEKLDGIPTLFIKSNSTVTLININFINNINEYRYALENNGKIVLINCTFDNDTYALRSNGDAVLINCTFINTSCEFNSVNESIINNSNFRNSSIDLAHSINSTITNSVFDGGSKSAITISNMLNRFSVDNCTFSNINSSGYGAAIYNIESGNCIFNITNSKFNNNSARWYGGACYFTTNATLENCSFDNNSALIGGSVYSGYYLNSTNCSYDGNSALYGGAIYGYVSDILINGSSFRDNFALMAGGAVSSYFGSTVIIDNSIFTNNSADVCGGAIVIGNSTVTVISNSNFTSNDGQDYGNDIYSYGSNLTLNNNSISSILDVSNDTLFVPSSDVSDGFVVYLDNNTTGFCLEENFHYPGSYNADYWYYGWYGIFNHTNLALNSLNYQKVGDYIKYIIVNYYGKVPNIVLNYAIWTFTDNNYTNPVTTDSIYNIYSIIYGGKYHYGPVSISPILASTLLGDPLDFDQIAAEVSEIVNDTLSAYNSGVRIPDHYVDVDENGTGTLYDFGSILSNFYQNFITFKTSNYTVVYDINITKITNNPVVYKGNDTSFDIVVANNGTMRLSNVTVTEDSYDDLVYKSSSNITGNWTYSFVNGKHTWTLVGYLGVNQTARFNVVFTTVNSTIGNKTNNVSVTTNENVTGNASNITEVIENNTPETPENNTPNTTENNTPNKPTPVDNGTAENNNTPKADVKTTEATGYPLVALIIALIGIIGTGFRKK